MHLLVGNSLTRHDFHGKGHDTFVKIAPAMLQQAVSVAVNQKMTWKLPGAAAQISGGAKAEIERRGKSGKTCGFYAFQENESRLS